MSSSSANRSTRVDAGSHVGGDLRLAEGPRPRPEPPVRADVRQGRRAVPNGFNECIGARKPFETCIAGGTKQYRRACSATSPCGPDYVCMAVPGAPPGIGACMPAYFIFQARVGGHLVGP